VQEVKQLVDQITKESKKYEKEEVTLLEKKKHLTTKQKKFKKSIAEVSPLTVKQVPTGDLPIRTGTPDRKLSPRSRTIPPSWTSTE
jgi:hypothetical protein